MNIYDAFFERLGYSIDFNIIDDLVVSDANILRPVKGHAFEILFDEVIKSKLHSTIIDEGGDSDVDRIVENNNILYTIQIKTPLSKTVKPNVSFQVALHKTHGMEKRPQSLYPFDWPCPICGSDGHDGGPFPQFLVIKHPYKGVLIVPKKHIPEHKKYPGHFADPATFEWDSEWLNRWDLLGFKEYKGVQLERTSISPQHHFPKIAQETLLSDEEIVKMWLKPENFRMIDMNLKGNLREPMLTKMFADRGIRLFEPSVSYPKYDRITSCDYRIQIKGASKNFIDIEHNTIGSEIMGSHGKGAIRCYSESDFDYFCMVIDPYILPPTFPIAYDEFHFLLVPISALPLHYRNSEWKTNNKIYPQCKFTINILDGKVAFSPYNRYTKPVSFRNNGPWFLDDIPEELK